MGKQSPDSVPRKRAILCSSFRCGSMSPEISRDAAALDPYARSAANALSLRTGWLRKPEVVVGAEEETFSAVDADPGTLRTFHQMEAAIEPAGLEIVQLRGKTRKHWKETVSKGLKTSERWTEIMEITLPCQARGRPWYRFDKRVHSFIF